MADYDSSLPVRTEAPGDLDIFVSDASTPSQKLKVNADGSIDTNFASGSAVEVTDGTDTLAINADGSINATVTATDLDIRDLTSATDSVEVLQDTHDDLNLNANLQVGDTDVANGNPVPISDAGGSLTVDATDLDVRDLSAAQDNVAISDGTDTLAINADGSITTGIATGAEIGITDGTDSLAINADGSLNATVTATDLDVRDLSAAQDNVAISDGTDTLAVNADGSINATVTATDLDVRDLSSAQDSVEILQATHDNLNLNANVQFADTDVTATNPLPVYIEENAGTELVDFNTSASVAAAASVNHDYTVPASTTFIGEELWASGSGKIKVEVLVAGSTVFVGFNSTSNPNVRIPLEKIVKAAATEVVRITLTNRDKQAQDVYSTLTGIERS